MMLESVSIDDVVTGHDGRAAVLVDQSVVVVSAIAARLLGSLQDGPRPLTEVASSLEAEFGAPPGGEGVEKAVEAVAHDLAAQGLLKIVSAP